MEDSTTARKHLQQASEESDLEQQQEHSHLLPTPSSPAVPPPLRRAHPRLLSALAYLFLAIVIWSLAYTFASYKGCSASDSKAVDPHWPTYIGYEGPTPTGVEPLAAATSYPINKDTSPLHPPPSLTTSKFNILHKLGNLAPWRSVDHGLGFSPSVPSGCEITQIHLLHRHGARYPTLRAGPAEFAKKFEDAKKAGGIEAKGPLEFLNEWSYALGAEVLSPFGRQQLFDLGSSFRTKYGALLPPVERDGKRKKKLVFRTESQDRMLKSSLNFAAGFFGIPFKDQYHQLITIEALNFNNTLAPYMTCPNANRPDLNLGKTLVPQWISIYLSPAVDRLQAHMEGFEFTVKDLYNLQSMCAYELVALGGSAFCDLFTEEEWEGFEYSLDLAFWYGYSFGQPAQAAIGKGWVQEWLARVEGKKLQVFDSSTNSSYHTDEYFPLDQNIYVDATHDTVISAIITTLQFSSFTASGPLPATHIPKNLSFDTTKISPFASNLQAQIMDCNGEGESRKMVRWLLNDGIVPLGHLGCDGREGMCDLGLFVEKTRERVDRIDWNYDCLHPYDLGSEPIMDGRPSSAKK